MSPHEAFPFYKGNRKRSGDGQPVAVPSTKLFRQSIPEAYIPDGGLVDAVNVALLLGQPLLLTGEPGTGKTQLAHSLSWELGFGDPLRFETKSTSTARDLFYVYNSIGRFHAAQTGSGSQQAVDYVTYSALGKAILRTRKPADIAPFLPEYAEHDGPTRSVVLIDEVDKAPRDFPNDILNEIEGMYFRVPELQNLEIAADPDLPPVVVITSNSEKHLPEAFLRRCIYYHIEFPDKDKLEEVILAHLSSTLDGRQQFVQDALDLFLTFRLPESGLRKRPATAELLNWIYAMQAIRPEDDLIPDGSSELVLQTLGCVTKTPEDRQAAKSVFKTWLQNL